MSYVNTGALVGSKRPKTKTALKAALKADPSEVYFDATSFMAPVGGYSGDEVPSGVKLSVVGPDPYSKRSWYATVENRNGVVVVDPK
jgi:hypothetical protein